MADRKFPKYVMVKVGQRTRQIARRLMPSESNPALEDYPCYVLEPQKWRYSQDIFDELDARAQAEGD
jgi:hypothetical protein